MSDPKIEIECKLRRAGGTHVSMQDGTTYHFKPRESDGRHTAEVTGNQHIGRLLSITEAYEVAPGEKVSEAKIEKAKDEADTTGLNDPNDVGTPDPDAPGANPDPDTPPEGSVAEAQKVIDRLDDLTDEQLRKTYEAELGRKPHSKAGRDTMIASIDAARNETAGQG